MTRVLASTTLLVGLATAILALLAAFGVPLTPDQHEAILGIIGAVLTLVGAWFHPDIPIGQKL